ncbi:MAG TPA: LamG domain-containing protein [bacterium]|nr:LamG domain-containing protein [bacterium]
MKKLAVLIIGIMFFWNLHGALTTHLKFEDNFEDSFGNYDGTNYGTNGGTTFATGKEGRSIYFDGGDYVEVGNGYWFDPRGADSSYSISLWVKSTEAASSSNANCYIGYHTVSGGNIFLLGYWSSTLRLQIMNTYVTVSTSAEPQEWTHYVVTAKENGTSTAAKVYKDGAQIWSGTINNVLTVTYNDKPWVLGQDWDSSTSKTDYFKGNMDNVRFYDNELDAAYVRQIFLKESSYVHLKFDDDFNDSVGSNHGTQTGGVLFKEGLENKSAWMDGYNDYIEFGSSTTDPRLTNGVYKDFSMSIWVKSHSSATTTDNNCYIGKHTGTGGNLFLFGYWSGALKIQIKSQVATVTTATEPTSWTHYVISGYEYSTNNTTTMKVFKNGEQIWEGTLNDTMGSFSSTKPWVLGMDWDSSTSKTDYLAGDIDNFRFYKRRLNAVYADEVQQLYLSEFSGLRYCDTTQYAAGCTTTTETDSDLSDTWWWIQSGLFGILVPHTSVESIKVSEGWEAYLCTSTNSQGTCHYFDDGVYASGTGLPSELLNSTYSITVQPKTFDAAKKYFGYKKVGESGNLPVGFAYFYQYANYAKPTKENDRRRLFMDSWNRNNFQNMSNTILGANRTSAAELFGNVYAILSDNSYNDKYLMTSHRDFAFYYSSYPDLDFRNYDDDVKQIYLVGQSQEVGSAGWFIANDVSDPGERDYVCLKGVNETINDNEMRIECMRYGYNDFAFNSDVYATEFFKRVHSGNKKKFEQYADNYNLLMLTGHGSFWMDDDETLAKIYIPYSDDAYRVYFTTKSDLQFNYSTNLGMQSTKWVEATACQSMGTSDFEWDDVGDAYYNVLTRLNGVGGYRNNSYWGGINDTHNYYDHWDDLAKSTKTVSKAWVDSWSEDFIGDPDRDARFLTLENCNCTQTASCNSYMLNDYFFNVQTGPMNQKTTLTGYNYYCSRDRGDLNIDNYVRTLNKSMLEETYPEEFSSYSIEPVADSIIEELMGIKIGGKETRAKGENDYSYRDDYLIMKKRGKDFSSIMNRTQESFRYDSDWEYEAKDRFEEAKAIAETLTTLDLEYAGISKDTNEAFEVGGDGESLGKSVNSISFVFRPKINGIPVFIEDISVEYDAAGLYQIRSRVPHSITLSRTGKIMAEEKAVEELSKSVRIEEANKGRVVYSLDENNELVLSFITKNEERREFKTISLEAKDE